MDELFDKLKAALADEYALERELGSGGMAIVFLAHDIKHERDVAIKVLRPELSASLGGDRFLREIKIAAKLSHPHISAISSNASSNYRWTTPCASRARYRRPCRTRTVTASSTATSSLTT
jgi:serine/threonine protein kinase